VWLAPVKWVEPLIWLYFITAMAAFGVVMIAKLRVFRRILRERHGSTNEE